MKKDIRKIYKTTDGYFNSRLDIKKTRLVAVLYQRDDSAVIVTKIYSKKNKKGNAYINKLTLKPKKHTTNQKKKKKPFQIPFNNIPTRIFR